MNRSSHSPLVVIKERYMGRGTEREWEGKRKRDHPCLNDIFTKKGMGRPRGMVRGDVTADLWEGVEGVEWGWWGGEGGYICQFLNHCISDGEDVGPSVGNLYDAFTNLYDAFTNFVITLNSLSERVWRERERERKNYREREMNQSSPPHPLRLSLSCDQEASRGRGTRGRGRRGRRGSGRVKRRGTIHVSVIYLPISSPWHFTQWGMGRLRRMGRGRSQLIYGGGGVLLSLSLALLCLWV